MEQGTLFDKLWRRHVVADQENSDRLGVHRVLHQ